MPANCTVYVGNVSSRVREKDLRRKFEKYGKVRRVELLRDFAFVDYDDPDDARDAIEGLDGYDMEGRALQVALARSKGPIGGRSPGRDSRDSRDSRDDRGGGGRRVGHEVGSPGDDRGRRVGHEIGSGIRGGAVRGKRDSCVMVKNLSSKTGWQDLKDWARQCGPVEYADIWMDRGKKYGVIKFENRKDIKNALEKLDDQYLDGRYVRVAEDTGSWTASVSSSRSRSRSPRGKKNKKSKERDRDEKKETKENKEGGSRSPSPSPEKPSKRKKRSRSNESDEGRKKDKRKKKDRSQSPEGGSSSSSSSTTATEDVRF